MLAYINLLLAVTSESCGTLLSVVVIPLIFQAASCARPFIAAWRNLPRLSWSLSNQAHGIHIQLHRQFGKMVQFGPNMVSTSDPAEISTIYGFNPVSQKVCELSQV